MADFFKTDIELVISIEVGTNGFGVGFDYERIINYGNRRVGSRQYRLC